MKLTRRFPLLLAALSLAGSAFFSSCTRDMCEYTYTYTRYVPQYMSYDDLRAPDAVQSLPARQISNPGKIYIKDQFLFVSEKNAGVHIIDNRNPSNPVPVSFIQIPGNVDIAANGPALYADSHVDLLVFDISNPASPTLVKRVENALPYPQYENGVQLDPTKGVVSNWKEETVTETVQAECESGFMNDQLIREDAVTANGGGSLDGTRNLSNGQGGSMARFAVDKNTLYIVTPEELLAMDVTSPGQPGPAHQIELGMNIETLYPADGYLFIGSATGMMIYDNTNPLNPIRLGDFQHATACDPVVAESGTAYVTLRGGTPCGGFQNQLDIVNVTNPTFPTLISTYNLTGPYGLGVDGTTLFVCDGTDGVRVYDVANPTSIVAIDRVQGMNAWDVIPNNDVLILTAEDGIYQFSYTNPNNLVQLSRISVMR